MLKTKNQKMAEKAFERVSDRKEASKDKKDGKWEEYKTFALSFPALIHSCGLVQAAAFACAKSHGDYLADLQAVFDTIDKGDLLERSRKAGLAEYTRITRHATDAATWLKVTCQGLDR
ncbi:MAG: type III-B CRISPR module-associated protein Cmr5 [Pyramidobacter sp.]|jgi:CRISPR-associated protein Cmr5